MTLHAILSELQSLGNDSTKRIWAKHGAREPFFGVKIEDLKKIQKHVKKDYVLAKQLYATGNSDAMYLAALIADERQMTQQDLQTWVEGAYWHMISEYAVAWVTAESQYGLALALEWIESPAEQIATAGWATLCTLMAIKPDSDLDMVLFQQLLTRVATQIHTAPNRVRYTMNNFVISVGTYLQDLTEQAIETARVIGKVSVDMGDTACKVPLATDYITKIKAMNRIGKKRKTARC